MQKNATQTLNSHLQICHWKLLKRIIWKLGLYFQDLFMGARFRWRIQSGARVSNFRGVEDADKNETCTGRRSSHGLARTAVGSRRFSLRFKSDRWSWSATKDAGNQTGPFNRYLNGPVCGSIRCIKANQTILSKNHLTG